MSSTWSRFFVLILLGASLVIAGCGSGSDGVDGQDGAQGPPGPPGGSLIDLSTAPDEMVAALEVESEITNVVVASPPVINFTVTTADGVPITGIREIWLDDSSYVRFTFCKLVPGTNGDPDVWVSYTRDATTNAPDYDTGSDLVDNGDGTYVFTYNTDVATVPGVPYEPTLTHRAAGQIGSRSEPLEAQNLWFDFVPAGGALPDTRYIAVVDSCNECHDELIFHGRRYLVEYCVTCHNPDLSSGEGNFPFMIHRLHSGGMFDVLRGGRDFSHVTYPQNLRNCRKCHNGADAATPQGDNWKMLPNIVACDGCHNNFSTGTHTGGMQTDNTGCAGCHPPSAIEDFHTTPDLTPNNPMILPNQRSIVYEMLEASVGGGNVLTINFQITSDGVPIDITNLPQDLLVAGRYPVFLLAWAMEQDGIESPADFNNALAGVGRLPMEIDIDALAPIDPGSFIGTITWDGSVNTATITDAEHQFPAGAVMRTVGLQGYLRQDLNGDDVWDESLHTPSIVATVDGDDARRRIVDNDKCANCHDRLELHGGNRVHEIAICQMCHVPNLSSSGRSITTPSGGLLSDFAEAHDLDPNIDPNNPLTYPEAANGIKDLIHGIHSSGFRTTKFEHVRGDRQGYYDWSHVTFPAEFGTRNCLLCHREGTYELPLPPNVLPNTVRTTDEIDGMDPTTGEVGIAFLNMPNAEDWINTPTGSACYGCHDNPDALAHMTQNGAFLSRGANVFTAMGQFWNRMDFGITYESCVVCHGPGRVADVEDVHQLHDH